MVPRLKVTSRSPRRSGAARRRPRAWPAPGACGTRARAANRTARAETDAGARLLRLVGKGGDAAVGYERNVVRLGRFGRCFGSRAAWQTGRTARRAARRLSRSGVVGPLHRTRPHVEVQKR